MIPRGRVAAALLVVALPAPGTTRAQAGIPSPGEPIIVELALGRYTFRTIPAFRSGGDVLLPVGIVAELAEIRYRLIPPDTAEIVLQPGDRRIRLDPGASEIRTGDTTLVLTPADRVVQDKEQYLATRILGPLLHTSFVVNWEELTVALLDADSLPVGRRLTRERAIAALRHRATEQPDLSLGMERVRWDGLVLDYSALMPSDDVLGGGAYSAGLGMNLLGGSLEASVASAGPARGGPARFDGSWTGVWRTSRWLTQVRLGDGLSTGPRPRTLRGLSLTNAPYLRQSFFEEIPFQGALGPGWQIEAYRGGRLLALDSADALGRFSLDLPVEYGENPVDFVAFGPFGEVRQFNQTYRVGSQAIPARRFEYGLALGGCRSTECSASGNLDLRYGLSRRWTVRGGMDRFWRDTLPGLSHPYLGMAGSLGNAWAVDFEAVAGAVLRSGLRYEPSPDLRLTAEYDDFASGTVAPLLTPEGRRSQWTLTAFARPLPRRDDVYLDAGLDRIAGDRGSTTSGRIGLSVFTSRVRLTPALRFTRTSDLSGTGFGRSVLSLNTFTLPFPELGPVLGRVSSRTSWEVDDDGRFAAIAGFLARALGPSLRLEAGVSWARGTGTAFAMYLSTQMPTVRATTTVTAGGVGPSGMTQFVQGSLLYDPAGRGVAFASGPSLERAGLSGRVFLDQDGNGRWTPGERLLPGVRLRAGYVTASSDSSGRYRVWDLPSYEPVTVAIDSATLASPLWVPAHGSVSVETGPNRFRELDVPILPGGVVEGRVLRESAGGPVAVPGARVLLRARGAGESRESITFSDGDFYLMGVRPGEYELVVDPGDQERLGVSGEPLRFSLPAVADGATVDGLELRLR